MSVQERLIDDGLLREQKHRRVRHGRPLFGLRLTWSPSRLRPLTRWFRTAKQRDDAYKTWERRIGDFWTRVEKVDR